MAIKIELHAKEIWHKFIGDAPEQQLDFTVEIQKKMLEFFQVGDYYWFIFNVRHAEFDFVSPEVEKVLGYTAGEMKVPVLLELIHPDDQSWFLNFENSVTEFFAGLRKEQVPNYKVRYDFRIRKKSGEYIRLLNQVVTIEHDNQFGVLRTFGVHTDITHIKPNGLPMLSFIGLNGEPSFINVTVKEVYVGNHTVLSRREREILHLMCQGKSTKEIGEQLFLSVETVKTHRRNILRKADVKNVTELLFCAIKNGWV